MFSGKAAQQQKLRRGQTGSLAISARLAHCDMGVSVDSVSDADRFRDLGTGLSLTVKTVGFVRERHIQAAHNHDPAVPTEPPLHLGTKRVQIVKSSEWTLKMPGNR